MKKLFVLTMIFALSLALSGVASATILTGSNINTSLARVDGGTGQGPIIKAKWEMYNERFNGCELDGEYTGEDALDTAGAQFAPPGIWDATMDYTVCAIVTDPNGVADIDGVYVDIYYPSDRAFHYQYPANTSYSPHYAIAEDIVNNNGNLDEGIHGCGEFIEENELLPLEKMEGYRLFCDTIHDNNNNLPKFFEMSTSELYSYSEICGAEGELMKETAKVYCDDKDLIWEDPAGNYLVKVFAIDNSGNFSYDDTGDNPIDYNEFQYLELVDFEVDFASVVYGDVALNSHKIISGDLDFGTSDKPSIRNVGNTRLWVKVQQDDMGLGKVGETWNVKFDARVGNEFAEWRNYWPDTLTTLQDILDLSELEEMDFSVLITKFPTIQTDYTGTLDLSASKAPFRSCVDTQ